MCNTFCPLGQEEGDARAHAEDSGNERQAPLARMRIEKGGGDGRILQA